LPEDSHSIASEAPDMLQTCAGSPFTLAAISISSLVQNHRGAFPSYSRCKIPSFSTSAFFYASHFISDSTVPHCHI